LSQAGLPWSDAMLNGHRIDCLMVATIERNQYRINFISIIKMQEHRGRDSTSANRKMASVGRLCFGQSDEESNAGASAGDVAG